MSTIEIEYLPVDRIIPYENNPRDNKDAVKAVAESIQMFGWKVPIVIDSNNVIVCGHTRLLAAKKLNIDSVPCIRANDLTEEQIQAYRLADNKTAELSKWDSEKLDLELEQLSEIGIDMSKFGFDSKLEIEPQEPKEIELPEVYSVLVLFKKEDDQMEFFSEMKNRGYECKLSYL